ncbi:selenocysteine synthase [Crateriforma conspicua]|uniref:Selenocysteine synthase n=2 Tax=Crateriforma conspicua TaxID=2527996 RepID=A0A5C5Y1B8_9PLAN|nr:selenocysteine synthase [Crateriforma conspicua]
MAMPPWTVELLYRQISDVAKQAQQSETIDKIKSRASELVQDLPDSAARGIESAGRRLDRLMKSAEQSTKAFRQWSEKFNAVTLPCVNATGTLLDPRCSPPISEVVVAAGIEAMQGNRVCDTSLDHRLHRHLHQAMNLADDRDVAVAASMSAALMAVSTISLDRPFLVPRSEVFRVDGRPTSDLLGGVFAMTAEIGDSRTFVAEDLAGNSNAILIRGDSGAAAISRDTVAADDQPWAAVLRCGTLRGGGDPATGGSIEGGDLASVGELLNQGAEFVVVPGDGLIGGPASGLIVGKKSVLVDITGHESWSAWAAGTATIAMLCEACERQASAAVDGSAALSMLNTSVENLKARCERLATRLSATDIEQTIQITDRSAGIIADGRWQLPSRQIELRRPDLDAKAWAEKLAQHHPSVLLDAEDDALRIDLRWVNPADDGRIAEAILD